MGPPEGHALSWEALAPGPSVETRLSAFGRAYAIDLQYYPFETERTLGQIYECSSYVVLQNTIYVYNAYMCIDALMELTDEETNGGGDK